MLGWGKKNDAKPAVPAATPASPEAAAALPHAEPVSASPPTGAPSLPNLLLTEGRITEAQLQKAMVKQAETGAFIGEILIEDGVLDQDSLISFLAKHCKIPHLSLLDYLIDKSIVEVLPLDLCLKYRLLPIDRLGKNLTVAMVNPLDTEALEQVRTYCPDLRIKPILCASSHFEIVVKRLFASEEAGATHELSASSLGLKIPGRKPSAPAPTALPPAAPPPSQPAPEAYAVPEAVPAAEEVEDSYELPPLEPTPSVVIAPATEEAMPDAVEVEPVAPLPEVAPVSAPAAQVLESVFNQPPPPPGPTPSLSESGLGTASSMLMREMATVMMDSMRDTYAVLARRMELFRGVPPEEVAKIFARGITQEFEPGQTIFEKGQAGGEMYVILGGEVLIKDGTKELARLGRGGMFGEMSLISAQPRSASAIALDTTSVLALSNDTIRQSMPPHVSLQLLSNIITTLSTRLRQANERQGNEV